MRLYALRFPLALRWLVLWSMAPALLLVYFIGSTTYLAWENEGQAQRQRITDFEQRWGPLLASRLDQEMRLGLAQTQRIIGQFDFASRRLSPLGLQLFQQFEALSRLFIFSGEEPRVLLALRRDLPADESTEIKIHEALGVEPAVTSELFADEGVTGRVVEGGDLILNWRRGELKYVAQFSGNSWSQVIRESAGDMTVALVNRKDALVFVVNEPQTEEWAKQLEGDRRVGGRRLASLAEIEKTFYRAQSQKIYHGHYLVAFAPIPKRSWSSVRPPEAALGWLLLALLILLTISFIPLYRAATGIGEISYVLSRSLQGNFDLRTELKGKDEVSRLGESLNKVLDKISLAMTQLAQKIRLESELSTAKSVQATLFPEPQFATKTLSLCGRSLAASETSGDWWHYSEVGGRVWLWIGDATGHGASAALLTSAARAVAAVIEFNPNISPSQALRLLNRAIYDTSKGQMMMTFFVATFDLNKGVIHYANASHEPPFRLPGGRGEAAKAKDFEPIIGFNNPRLGESRDMLFKESSLILKKGDRLIFYTDGIVEAANPMGKNWGERRFLNALGATLAESEDVCSNVENIFKSLDDHRQEAPLDDDVTLIVLKWEGANE